MSMHIVSPPVQVTPPSTGVYDTIDLDSHTTVPSGATAVLIYIQNTVNGGRNVGVRTTGKTTEVIPNTNTFSNLGGAQAIVPLGSGNQIDFYRSATGVTFFILGFFSSAWTWFDLDAAAVNLPSGGGSISTVTAPSDVSASATIILAGQNYSSRWRPTGETTQSDPLSGPFVVMRLNGSRQVDVDTGETQRIMGYTTTGVTWRTWYPANDAAVEDGTFYDAGATSPGDAFAFGVSPAAAATEGFVVRQNGDTTISTVPSGCALLTTTATNSWMAPLDASGIFEWAGENATSVDLKVLGWIANANVTGTSTIAWLRI